jgi:hypothetical protein
MAWKASRIMYIRKTVAAERMALRATPARMRVVTGVRPPTRASP